MGFPIATACPTRGVKGEINVSSLQPQTFALESYVKRSLNYLSRMVDQDGQPYFNVFWTQPAEAAHDWPDFGDVTSRQLQAAIMARHMTREEVPMEKVWLKTILSYLDPDTGLILRPNVPYADSVTDRSGDQALTLYALLTAYLDRRDDVLQKAIFQMVNSLLVKIERNDPRHAAVIPTGFCIKSLMVCARYLNYDPALKLARLLVSRAFADSSLFTPDNAFRPGAHMHTSLRTLVGAADYALHTGDPIMYNRVDALYCYVRSQATRFGFLPEMIGRKGDIFSCETCAIMDYLGLAVTLANHGHPEYWADVERVARNHLIESQMSDGSWLLSDSTKKDTAQYTWTEIGQRMEGGFAGWSSPNHILACKETLNAHWGGPELRDKPRAFQNCCGGSGVHALFTVWKNAARFEDGGLSVNMHIDKLIPQAEIRCYQPFVGLLIIKLKEPCEVKVRIPDFVTFEDMKIEADSENISPRAQGNYMELGKRQQGEVLRITYPLPVFEEEVNIGNLGFRQYTYRVTYKGDTVVRMQPLGNEYTSGYSEFDKRDVPTFYGTTGPAPLYQREYILKHKQPELSALRLDDSPLDFWYFR